MRIAGRLRAGTAYVAWRSELCGGQRGVAVRAVEIGEAAVRPDGVDMALGENGAQPRFERASPVEITEQGAAVGTFAQTVQLCEERIRQFARGRRVRRTAQNSPRSGTHVPAKR